MPGVETRAWEGKGQILRGFLSLLSKKFQERPWQPAVPPCQSTHPWWESLYSWVRISAVRTLTTPGAGVRGNLGPPPVQGGRASSWGRLPAAPFFLRGSCLGTGHILGLGRLKRDWCLLAHASQWVGLSAFRPKYKFLTPVPAVANLIPTTVPGSPRCSWSER